jgi:hypothetical protein
MIFDNKNKLKVIKSKSDYYQHIKYFIKIILINYLLPKVRRVNLSSILDQVLIKDLRNDKINK